MERCGGTGLIAGAPTRLSSVQVIQCAGGWREEPAPLPVPEAPVSIIPALFTKAMLKWLQSSITSLFFFSLLDHIRWSQS